MRRTLVAVIILCALAVGGCTPSWIDGGWESPWPPKSRDVRLRDKQAELERCKENLAAVDEVAREAEAEAQASAGTCPITGKPNEVVSVEVLDDPRPKLRERIAELERDIAALKARAE